MGQSYEAATLFMLYTKGYEDGAKQIVHSNKKIDASSKRTKLSAAEASAGFELMRAEVDKMAAAASRMDDIGGKMGASISSGIKSAAKDARLFGADLRKILSPEAYEANLARLREANRNRQRNELEAYLAKAWGTSNPETLAASQRGRGMGRASSFVGQAGFAIEDFSIGMQLGGPQMAMRGVSNNLSMMAMAAGGLGGALAALATVITVNVVPAISKLSQSTKVFAGLEDRVEGFAQKLQSAADKLSYQRRNSDEMFNFNKLDDTSGIAESVRQQRLTTDRTAEDLQNAKNDLNELIMLREQLISDDFEESQKKNALQKFMSGVSPVMQDMFNAASDNLFGTDALSTGGVWNNSKEIKDEFKSMEKEINDEISKLKMKLKAEEGLLSSMTEAAPGKFAEILKTTAEEGEQAFAREMAGGPLEQLQVEYGETMRQLAEQHQQALRDAVQASNGDLEKQKELIAEVNETFAGLKDRHEELHLKKTEEVQKELDRQKQGEIKGINSAIEDFGQSLLSPYEQEVKSIADEAAALREAVRQSEALSEEDKKSRLLEIDQLEKQRKSKVWEDNQEHSMKSSGQGSQLGALYAGSDAILAGMKGAPSKQEELLAQIEKNTGKSQLIAEVV